MMHTVAHHNFVSSIATYRAAKRAQTHENNRICTGAGRFVPLQLLQVHVRGRLTNKRTPRRHAPSA